MHARPQLAALCVAALCVGFASGAAPAPKKEEAAELTVTECKASNASKWTKVGKQLKSGGMCLTVDGCDIPGASESTVRRRLQPLAPRVATAALIAL